MRIEEGKQVKEGDALARLDAAEQEAALKLARAELELAEAGLAKANEGAGKAEVATAQAKVKVARARVGLAEHRLACAVVRAPVSGTVLLKRAEVGSRVDPKGFQAPASLCDLADLRTLDVEIRVPERDLRNVFLGQRCAIRVEAAPDASYRGRVVRILPVADRMTGTVATRVRVDLPEGDPRLRPELSAIVQFIGKK
jgi:HlyD family secretion protein